jgi:hypothetical protein
MSTSYHNGNIVVDNGIDGFSLFRCDIGSIVHTFETPRSNLRSQNGVAFFRLGGYIIGGSDHGRAYIFDVSRRTRYDILHHAQQGNIHHVAVSSGHFHH